MEKMKQFRTQHNESKEKKYLWILVFACFLIPTCSGQSKKIIDYNIASWNTAGNRGSKWEEIANKVTIPMILDSGFEILALQEAGILPNLQTSTPSSNVDIVLRNGTILRNKNMGIDQYDFRRKGKRGVFVYKLNRNTYNKAIGDPVFNNSDNKIPPNLVMCSRFQADKVILIQHIYKIFVNRYINRPALGIVIGNVVFFTIHARPNNTENEAPDLINAIQRYMKQHEPQKTWITMGDFNRIPSNLEPNLDPPGNLYYHKIIFTRENTQGRLKLDYGVVGGPKRNFPASDVPEATLIPFPRYVDNPSDHKPVQFKRQVKRL